MKTQLKFELQISKKKEENKIRKFLLGLFLYHQNEGLKLNICCDQDSNDLEDVSLLFYSI